jgi:hypothetical protein
MSDIKQDESENNASSPMNDESKSKAIVAEVVPEKKPRYAPGSRKGKGGRPGGDTELTRPIVINLICYLIGEGKSDREIARIINVPKSTFERWKKKNAELWAAHVPNSDSPIKDVEKALVKKAKGFWVERPVYDKSGNIRFTKFQYYPPDNGAIQYYLNNRAPADWKSKVEHNHAIEELPVAIIFEEEKPISIEPDKKSYRAMAITDDYGELIYPSVDDDQGNKKA